MPMAFGWDGKIFDGTGKFWIGREADADADADGMGKYLMGRKILDWTGGGWGCGWGCGWENI